MKEILDAQAVLIIFIAVYGVTITSSEKYSVGVSVNQHNVLFEL